MAELAIDPDQLRSAAESLESASGLPSSGDGKERQLPEAVGNQRLSAATSDALAQWDQEREKASMAVKGLATGLRDVADLIVGLDGELAKRFRESGWLP